ncbi:MAG TPA: hypothetical protein GX743_08605 [Actinomycetales bacterium]|nr:hypothetical protein [Actinomycetales bacterium]
MPRGLTRGITLLLVAAAMTVACADLVEDPDNVEDAPYATFSSQGEGHETALLEGELVIVDGCLVIRADLPEPVPVAFPETAKWHADDKTVILGERELTVGEQVSVMGGLYPLEDLLSGNCLGRGDQFLVSALGE